MTRTERGIAPRAAAAVLLAVALATAGVTLSGCRGGGSAERTETPAVRGKRRLLSVVVPLLNEEATLAELYRQLDDGLQALDLDWEVVYVDDGSTDGSYRELVRLHEANLNVRIVRLRRNFGKAAALAAGIDVAGGDIVVTMDADLQDDPAEIPHLLVKLEEGFDLVSGWKAKRRDPLSRRLLSRVFNRVVGWLAGTT